MRKDIHASQEQIKFFKMFQDLRGVMCARCVIFWRSKKRQSYFLKNNKMHFYLLPFKSFSS